MKSNELDDLLEVIETQSAVSRWQSHHTNGSAIPNTLIPADRVKKKPRWPKAKLNPIKEWERVKKAWGGDVAAWQRYSGFKLPDDYVD